MSGCKAVPAKHAPNSALLQQTKYFVLHVALHLADSSLSELALPSSHSSPGSTTLLPQIEHSRSIGGNDDGDGAVGLQKHCGSFKMHLHGAANCLSSGQGASGSQNPLPSPSAPLYMHDPLDPPVKQMPETCVFCTHCRVCVAPQ